MQCELWMTCTGVCVESPSPCICLMPNNPADPALWFGSWELWMEECVVAGTLWACWVVSEFTLVEVQDQSFGASERALSAIEDKPAAIPVWKPKTPRRRQKSFPEPRR